MEDFTFIYLRLSFFLQIFEYQQITNEEKMILGKWISQLCQQWEMPSDGQTLVHLCISGSNYGNSYKNCPDTEPYLRYVITI